MFRSDWAGGSTGSSLLPALIRPGTLLARYIDAPIDFRWTYSYKVYARLPSGATEIRRRQPAGQRDSRFPSCRCPASPTRVVPSDPVPRRLDLTVRWTAVKDVEKYVVWDET